MNGVFTVFSYPNAEGSDIVYFEHTAGEVYLDSPEDVRQHMEQFESLGEVAQSPSDSVAFLAEKAKEWCCHRISRSLGTSNSPPLTP
jgi:hypothetical protein